MLGFATQVLSRVWLSLIQSIPLIIVEPGKKEPKRDNQILWDDFAWEFELHRRSFEQSCFQT